jgi:hypothetical protein
MPTEAIIPKSRMLTPPSTPAGREHVEEEGGEPGAEEGHTGIEAGEQGHQHGGAEHGDGVLEAQHDLLLEREGHGAALELQG